MLELTTQQMAVLERLRDRGFSFAAFPLYAQHIGVKKGNCAALLSAQDGGRLTVYGGATYVVAGQLGARVHREEGEFFVFKKSELSATPGRIAELERFATELDELLAEN
ncbi:MAG: hypothetical protein ACRD5W_10400 [Candidatus Acidiferrales bacterium]